ncbi:MAG: C39 family peptidase [Acidobacteria bacterium]|nr:C39 family peptidase [Acidobacteriota bacterium]MBS1865506.1 C39 family peptidase [Acidobacteriota bacterium]
MRARLILGMLLTVPVLAAGAAGSGLWLDVPFIHQEKEGCGSAALAMVLQYWSGKGVAVAAERMDAEKIQQQLHSKEARGIQASEMERYLRDAGFSVFVIAGEWKDLAAHIEKGRPLIAAIQPKDKASLHYVVVVGVDGEREAVLLNDPERGKLFRVERSEFETEWHRTDNWTLLAVPKQAK